MHLFWQDLCMVGLNGVHFRLRIAYLWASTGIEAVWRRTNVIGKAPGGGEGQVASTVRS